MTSKLIIYACPIGPLGTQLDTFFARSRAEIGPNSAHGYMPHCTLTGFFHDEPPALPLYCAALEAALKQARPTRPDPVISIERVLFKPEFHGLELHSAWLRDLTADFAARAASPTRNEALRLKDWLHLSLAYNFASEQHAALRRLAEAIVDVAAPVAWELRFYERCSDGSWHCHASWDL